MFVFLDAILSHESDSVQNRVLSLEKKVQQQDDEIVCLKSALADALRRLAALEAGLSVWLSRCFNMITSYNGPLPKASCYLP